jgi:remodeling and spacing factor 1
LAYVGISLANVLPTTKAVKRASESSEGSSDGSSDEEDDASTDEASSDDEPVYQLRQRRATNNPSYRFNEYDDLINSAIQVPHFIYQFYMSFSSKTQLSHMFICIW